MDLLTIGPIAIETHLGWHEEERSHVQTVVIELAFSLDTKQAGLQDNLAHTIDFGIVNQIRAKVSGSTYKLLERLAEDVAAECLSIASIQQVCVTASKHLPFDSSILGTIRIERSR